MHEAQIKDEEKTESIKIKAGSSERKRGTPRPKMYFAVVKFKDIDPATGNPMFFESVLIFETKAQLREALSAPKFSGTDIKVIRGHLMNVKARNAISIN